MNRLSLRTKLLVGALLLAAGPLRITAFLVPPRIEKVLLAQGRSSLTEKARDLAVLAEHVITQHREVVKSVASVRAVTDAVATRNADTLDEAGLARLNRQLAETTAQEFGHAPAAALELRAQAVSLRAEITVLTNLVAGAVPAEPALQRATVRS